MPIPLEQSFLEDLRVVAGKLRQEETFSLEAVPDLLIQLETFLRSTPIEKPAQSRSEVPHVHEARREKIRRIIDDLNVVIDSANPRGIERRVRAVVEAVEMIIEMRKYIETFVPIANAAAHLAEPVECEDRSRHSLSEFDENDQDRVLQQRLNSIWELKTEIENNALYGRAKQKATNEQAQRSFRRTIKFLLSLPREETLVLLNIFVKAVMDFSGDGLAAALEKTIARLKAAGNHEMRITSVSSFGQ